MRRAQVGVALCGLVVLAGCSGGGSHQAKGPSTKSSATTATTVKVGWTRSDLKAVTQPVAAGGNFIVYVASGSGLQVVALDPTTGKTVWQAAASGSVITPGEAPMLGVFGTTVTFFEPTAVVTSFDRAATSFDQAGTNLTAKLAAVNGATGVAVWTSTAGLFDDWPQPCIDNPAAVCTTESSSLSSTANSRLLRFEASDGAALPAPVISTTDIARQIGPDLFDPGTRNPEQLAATDGSSVAWRVALSSVFPEPGFSTDNGWNFDRVPADGLFVGSVLGAPVSSTASQDVLDLSRTATAGFRIANGVKVWRDAGSTYLCGPLPCPGMTHNVAGTSAYTPPTAGLRLRMTGTETIAASGGTPTLAPGTKIVVEGFDLATGHTTWSVDAGANAALAQASAPPQIGQEVVILPDAAGNPMALDLTTGKQSPIPPGSTAFCQAMTTYTGPPHETGAGTTNTDYAGGSAEFPCSASGTAVAEPAQVPAFVGPTLGGVTAWSEANQVVGAAPAG